MATAVSWLVGSVLMFVEFGVLACSAAGSRRRSWFYVRLSCASLVMLAAALGLALAISFSVLPQRAGGLLWVALLLAALAVAPVFCYHAFAAFQGSSEGDGGGGPGSGPPTAPPRGGAPLPDAEHARARKRDHNRPSLRGVHRRRPAVEPVRQAPAGPGRRSPIPLGSGSIGPEGLSRATDPRGRPDRAPTAVGTVDHDAAAIAP
jgi:hypothetical protein